MSLFFDINAATATIESGTALSAGAVNLGNQSLVGIVMPSGWDTADITFQASADGGNTFQELCATDGVATDAVAPIQIHSPSASQFIAIAPEQLRGVNVLKVRSGTSGSPVNQTATRVLTVIMRGIG